MVYGLLRYSNRNGFVESKKKKLSSAAMEEDAI